MLEFFGGNVMKYAIIEDLTVTNIIEASGKLPGLYMIPCSDEVGINWKYIDEVFSPSSIYITAEENKNKAIIILKETDWVEIPSVSDINNTPYLININDFIKYRVLIRNIAINPSEGIVEFPVKPTSIWST